MSRMSRRREEEEEGKKDSEPGEERRGKKRKRGFRGLVSRLVRVLRVGITGLALRRPECMASLVCFLMVGTNVHTELASRTDNESIIYSTM